MNTNLVIFLQTKVEHQFYISVPIIMVPSHDAECRLSSALFTLLLLTLRMKLGEHEFSFLLLLLPACIYVYHM
jgi:hypothetical protein